MTTMMTNSHLQNIEVTTKCKVEACRMLNEIDFKATKEACYKTRYKVE
jgi:hypothetical protein